MLRPKSITEQDSKMAADIKAALDQKRAFTVAIIDDPSIDDAQADAAVTEFNEQWIGAGGSGGTTLGFRSELGLHGLTSLRTETANHLRGTK